MKTLLCAFIIIPTLAMAQNTRSGCFQALDHSAKRGKPSIVMANSPRIWNNLLEDQIHRSKSECNKGTKKKCLSEFLRNLAACDGVGDAHLQSVVEKNRRLAEAQAVRAGKRVASSK
jgi:hypothetical protein